MKIFNRGFAWLPVLIVVGLVVLLGGYGYVKHQQTTAVEAPSSTQAADTGTVTLQDIEGASYTIQSTPTKSGDSMTKSVVFGVVNASAVWGQPGVVRVGNEYFWIYKYELNGQSAKVYIGGTWGASASDNRVFIVTKINGQVTAIEQRSAAAQSQQRMTAQTALLTVTRITPDISSDVYFNTPGIVGVSSYYIDFGDGQHANLYQGNDCSSPVSWCMSHSYKNPGDYTAKLYSGRVIDDRLGGGVGSGSVLLGSIQVNVESKEGMSTAVLTTISPSFCDELYVKDPSTLLVLKRGSAHEVLSSTVVDIRGVTSVSLGAPGAPDTSTSVAAWLAQPYQMPVGTPVHEACAPGHTDILGSYKGGVFVAVQITEYRQ